MCQDTLNDALDDLSTNGYCLWVGAGIDLYLSQMEQQQSYAWGQLTTSLEELAASHGTSSGATQDDFPARLEQCEDVLGRERLIREVRDCLVTPIHQSISTRLRILRDAYPDAFNNEWIQSGGSYDFSLPTGPQGLYDSDDAREFRTLEKLGRYANPIVNFNLTQEGSILLREPSSAIRICSSDHRWRSASAQTNTFLDMSIIRRRGEPILDVIHPHGILRGDGDSCILTLRDYDRALLAFQVATAATYQKKLAIVGMSLQDNYLCEQLQEFRGEIDDIYWFTSDSSEPAQPIPDITHIPTGGWDNFWNTLDERFTSQRAEPMSISGQDRSQRQNRSDLWRFCRVLHDLGEAIRVCS